jgi:hypothetical protein
MNFKPGDRVRYKEKVPVASVLELLIQECRLDETYVVLQTIPRSYSSGIFNSNYIDSHYARFENGVEIMMATL